MNTDREWLIKSQKLITNLRGWLQHGLSETSINQIDDYWREWREAPEATHFGQEAVINEITDMQSTDMTLNEPQELNHYVRHCALMDKCLKDILLFGSASDLNTARGIIEMRLASLILGEPRTRVSEPNA